MEPVTYVTGGLCVAMFSGLVGNVVGGRKKVKDCTCKERRESCQALLIEKIDHLAELIKGEKETD